MPEVTGGWRPAPADPSHSAWYVEKCTGSRTMERARKLAVAHNAGATPSEGVTMTGRSAIHRHAAASTARNGPGGIAATAATRARYGGLKDASHCASANAETTSAAATPPIAATRLRATVRRSSPVPTTPRALPNGENAGSGGEN